MGGSLVYLEAEARAHGNRCTLAFTTELALPALQRTPTHGVDPDSCCYLAHVLVGAGNSAVGDEAGEADFYAYRKRFCS